MERFNFPRYTVKNQPLPSLTEPRFNNIVSCSIIVGNVLMSTQPSATRNNTQIPSNNQSLRKLKINKVAIMEARTVSTWYIRSVSRSKVDCFLFFRLAFSFLTKKYKNRIKKNTTKKVEAPNIKLTPRLLKNRQTFHLSLSE